MLCYHRLEDGRVKKKEANRDEHSNKGLLDLRSDYGRRDGLNHRTGGVAVKQLTITPAMKEEHSIALLLTPVEHAVMIQLLRDHMCMGSTTYPPLLDSMLSTLMELR